MIYRLKKEGIIRAEYKGGYYKPFVGIFGESKLSLIKLRQLKYLKDKQGNIKGYITVAKLFNILVLSTQVPNVTDIATNECKYHKQYDMKLRTYISKPKIQINNENYKYLQFIDILENRVKINIEAQNANEILYNVIKEYNLDFEKILKYVRETKSKNIIDKLLVLAR
ncbi:MAG: hypothetical protein IJ809_03325 [Clostridia bacterium]|nr:hypothetical protein [Clostridia bacterium]